jgi:NADPH:quinone reductase-like Zn-dependent oxidoreductase
MSTVQQLQLPQRGERLTVVSVERPTPSPDEVCIRAKAVALNPLDWKNRAFGIVVPAWPAVLGVDGAGIVEAVGDAVKDFKVGDEVLSLCGMAARAGAFQEIITVPVNLVAKKPASLSFEEAASLP